MERNEFSSISEFDSATSTRHMKMLKLALPFLPAADKGFLSIYIKLSELIYTFQLIKKPHTFFPTAETTESGENYEELLHALAAIGNEQEKQLFSQLAEMLKAFHMYESYAPLLHTFMETSAMNTSDNPSSATAQENSFLGGDMLLSLLSPEQLELFQNFKKTI